MVRIPICFQRGAHAVRIRVFLIVFCCVISSVSALHAQLLVGHRGASFDAPENTCASFRLAWEQGADAIEGDYYLTSDDQIVCIHDPTTERVSDKNLPVAQSTLEELQALDVSSWKDPRLAGERMPRLQDVLALVPNDKCIYLEVKCGPEIVLKMREALADSQLAPRQTMIISFNREVIRAAKQAMPDRQAYWLVDFRQDDKSGEWSPSADQFIADAKHIHADGVDLNGIEEVVNADLIARCRQAGLSVHVWTIDDPEVAARYQRLGVDSITTNRPRALRNRLFPSQTRPAAMSQAPPVDRAPVQSQPSQLTNPAAVQ